MNRRMNCGMNSETFLFELSNISKSFYNYTSSDEEQAKIMNFMIYKMIKNCKSFNAKEEFKRIDSIVRSKTNEMSICHDLLYPECSSLFGIKSSICISEPVKGSIIDYIEKESEHMESSIATASASDKIIASSIATASAPSTVIVGKRARAVDFFKDNEEDTCPVSKKITIDTEARFTEAPITEAPITEAQVTVAPVTVAPITEAPVTEARLYPYNIIKSDYSKIKNIAFCKFFESLKYNSIIKSSYSVLNESTLFYNEMNLNKVLSLNLCCGPFEKFLYLNDLDNMIILDDNKLSELYEKTLKYFTCKHLLNEDNKLVIRSVNNFYNIMYNVIMNLSKYKCEKLELIDMLLLNEGISFFNIRPSICNPYYFDTYIEVAAFILKHIVKKYLVNFYFFVSIDRNTSNVKINFIKGANYVYNMSNVIDEYLFNPSLHSSHAS